MRIAVAARRDAKRRQHRFDIGDALGGGGFADFGHQNDGRQNHLARAEIAANVGRHHRATGEEDGGEQKGDFFHRIFPGWAEKVSNPPASGFGADYTTRRRKCARRQRRGRIPRIRLPCALLFPFPAKAGIQIGSAEYGGIETLPAFAETGDSNWIPAFAGKGFDNIAGRTMIDSFSSVCDSARNFFCRRWRWVVGTLDKIPRKAMADSFSSAYDSARSFFRRRWHWLVGALDKIPRKAMVDFSMSVYDSLRNFLRHRWGWLVGALILLCALILYFIFGNYLAVFLGYAETVTETVIENGESVVKKTTSWLSPGARLLRDSFIAIAAILGIVMAGWRNFALDRQSKAASEQAKNDSDRIAGEQFSDAVKLLAQKDAENKPAIDARIGGIYSLQTLANNHIEKYGAQVVKTLIAYIKQNVQLTAHPPLKENETPQKVRALGEDVKTAFNVLRQLLAAREKNSAEWNKPSDGIKLSDQDLSFSGRDFSRLDLNADQVGGLHRYIWSWVNLQGAKLFKAELQGADLEGAKLQGADLTEAQLQGANLTGAQLQGAVLWESQLQGARLYRAQLKTANLKGNLQGAELSEAKLDDVTMLPSDLSGKIWHSKQPELSEVDSLLPNAVWNLNPFLRSGYALAGVLRNFALRDSQGNDDDETRAKKLRMAARTLDKKKLPEDFPQDWRDWLDGIEPNDNSHPNDSGRLG